jgi:hypothetical protein
MFKKFDQIMDRLMGKTWFRVLFFTLMILNVLFTTIGMIVLALLSES